MSESSCDTGCPSILEQVHYTDIVACRACAGLLWPPTLLQWTDDRLVEHQFGRRAGNPNNQRRDLRRWECPGWGRWFALLGLAFRRQPGTPACRHTAWVEHTGADAV